MIKVVINEQHKLKNEQKSLLDKLTIRYGCEKWERLDVPKMGWTAREQFDVAENLSRSSVKVIVFASPLPYMIKLMVVAYANGESGARVLVFHNDLRDKKELPNGKIIFTVAEEGWQLL